MIRSRHSILAALTVGIWICSGCAQSAAPIPSTNSSVVDENGTVHVTRVVPVPETVSPEAQKFLGQQRSDVDDHMPVEKNRENAEHWQETLAKDMQSMYPTTLTRDSIAGVPVRVITPPSIPGEKREWVLINLHGGGFQADWGSVAETVPIASLTKTKVIAVLYRLAPEHPFPAALEDAITVYKELLKTHKPKNIAIYGTSAGAILTGEVAVRLKQLGLPLPAALGIFSGSGDYSRKGDSAALYGQWGLSGYVSGPSKAANNDPYVGSTNPRDPVLSPIFAELKGLPPTLFLTSERDALLSSTVNLHRAFRKAGVEVDLVVFDGLSHAYWNQFTLPESIEADHTIAEFFDNHLGK